MKNHLLLAGLLICGAAGLIGQSGRDAYRQAFDSWRQAQANLERDAGTGGTAVVSQADRAAAAEQSFEATRAAYLKSAAQDAAQRRQILQTTGSLPSPDVAPSSMGELVAGELQTVTRTVARFATDKDRGIQQLRQSLERERDALTALDESIRARQKTVAAASTPAAALEQARVKTAEAFGGQTTQLSQAATEFEKEGVAWTAYYEKLTQAIEIANAPPPPAPVAAVTPRTDSAPLVPLARYVGAWTFPMVNGIFHGPQPEFVDLVVHEENGHVDGTLFGRFKLQPGGPSDPLVRFDFQGNFGPTASQRFSVVSNDGTRGTIELIPGPAFNLLEVNFLNDPQPNKIRAGNFIVVKK